MRSVMRGGRSHFGPALLGAASFVAAALLVEALIHAGVIDRFLVPLPSEVFVAIGRITSEENVFARFLLTAGETLVAGVLLAVIGVSLGILLYRFVLLRRACETWVAAMASAPIVLMYPLFLVIFGRSATTIIMMGFLAALPAVILKTLEGLTSTRQVLVLVGKSLSVTRWQLYSMILLPAALPSIFVGLRLGLMFALINIVGIEFLINFGGLGQLVNELAERYDLPGMYAAICWVILVSIVFFAVAEKLERWLIPSR